MMMMVRMFQAKGHLNAQVDPLELEETYQHFEGFTEKFKSPKAFMRTLLDYKYYGFTDEDLNKEIFIDGAELGGILGEKKHWVIGELIDALKQSYCGKIGLEYMHIPYREECTWLRNTFEFAHE